MVKSKPPELIQAEIATFAAERIPYYKDEGYIFSNLAGIALGRVDGTKRLTMSGEYIGGQPVPEGTERIVATTGEFLSFLRAVGPHYEPIQGRVTRLQEYANFAPAVEALKIQLAGPATRKQHPNYLGSSTSSTVFSLAQDGKAYAVRMPGGPGLPPEHVPKEIDNHLAAAVLGDKGSTLLKQTLENIVAASYEDGVTVSELMPEKRLDRLEPNEVRTIKDEHLSDFLDVLVEANRLGIAIDPNPTNIFYDAVKGYGLIDSKSLKTTANYEQPLEHVIIDIALSFEKIGRQRVLGYEKTAADYSRELEFRKARTNVIQRYRSMAERTFTGLVRQNILSSLDNILTRQ